MQNLKSKYEQKEMKVSDDLWSRLEEKLDQVPSKEEKPKIFWLRYAAIILLIIGLGGSFWIMNNKSNIKENQEFANQTENQNLTPIELTKNNEVENLIPINNDSKNDNQKLAIENVENPSNKMMPAKSVTDENRNTNLVSDPKINIQKEEISIPKPEEELAQNETQKPKESPKYVSASDLLFGVEIDKAKSERPKTVMGINTSKSKNDSDFPNPKRIKLFGITLYDKDSITTK